MKKDMTSRDFLVDRDALSSRVEIDGVRWVPPPFLSGVKEYSDAELYRIIVAQSLREGRFTSKYEFDAAARAIGTIEEADRLIAFSKLRPGCRAHQVGGWMGCECGARWSVGDSNPPSCM